MKKKRDWDKLIDNDEVICALRGLRKSYLGLIVKYLSLVNIHKTRVSNIDEEVKERIEKLKKDGK